MSGSGPGCTLSKKYALPTLTQICVRRTTFIGPCTTVDVLTQRATSDSGIKYCRLITGMLTYRTTRQHGPTPYFPRPVSKLYETYIMPQRGFLAEFDSPEWKLSRAACKFDDTTLFAGAISMTAADNLDTFYQQALHDSITRNAIRILKQLLDRGVSLQGLTGSQVAGHGETSLSTVELLIKHGWDIDARGKIGSNARPFMWCVVSNYDKVKWCLDHGASVHPRNQEPLQADIITQSQRSCEQILEEVAAWGSVATFELLRSKGAPLGWRPLHRAVETATYYDPSGKTPLKYEDRMNMVRHLIEVVKLDVNALDAPLGTVIGNRAGTPICYIPGSTVQHTDTRELTWLLLDHGANPEPGLEFARKCECWHFIKDVEAWNTQKGGRSKCCVQ